MNIIVLFNFLGTRGVNKLSHQILLMILCHDLFLTSLPTISKNRLLVPVRCPILILDRFLSVSLILIIMAPVIQEWLPLVFIRITPLVAADAATAFSRGH
jgi:hypothetical protein